MKLAAAPAPDSTRTPKPSFVSICTEVGLCPTLSFLLAAVRCGAVRYGEIFRFSHGLGLTLLTAGEASALKSRHNQRYVFQHSFYFSSSVQQYVQP